MGKRCGFTNQVLPAQFKIIKKRSNNVRPHPSDRILSTRRPINKKAKLNVTLPLLISILKEAFYCILKELTRVNICTDNEPSFLMLDAQ